MTELLITTNGFTTTWPAIEYGSWLASHLNLKVTLLGINEKLYPVQIDDHNPLEQVFERAISLFNEHGVKYSLQVQNGNAEEIIPQKALEADYITLIGPLGRARLRHLVSGRSIRQIMEDISSPILYVPQVRVPINKILICIGGLGYELTAEYLALQIAKISSAEIALMHVVPPVELNYPTARIVSQNLDHLVDTDTPQGRSLRQAMNAIQETGLSAEIKVRQGNIVEELLNEIKTGGYDLLCMGSSYSGNSLRQLYAPNVTAEIAESVNVPVLTARLKKV